jgi:hypothetical protein
MTECDSFDQITIISANLLEMNNGQASYIAIYLTAIFAYIVAAYSAGANLTRLQVTISNILFCMFATVIVTRIIGLGAAMNTLTAQVAEMSDEGYVDQFAVLDRPLRLWIASTLWPSGVLFALAFMWSVRHPKAK